MKQIQKWMIGLAIMSTPILTTAAQAQKDYQFAVGTSATESREQWAKLTSGEELTRGTKVQFFPAPNYGLTTDENDPYDLTDGKLSSREDDRVWFNKDAVGWHWGAGTNGGILMVLDLGSVQPIGQIAIRVLGGREQGSLELPASAEFLASTDGSQYYSLQKMVKLSEAEKEQADMKTAYYYPEEGKAYMAPLLSRQAVRARYIALRITPQSTVYADQISILKAPALANLQPLESFPKADVYTDGLAILPRHKTVTVTTNIATPNWLVVMDNSGLNPAKDSMGFRLELPQGLRVLPQSIPAFKQIATKPGFNTYEFTYNGKTHEGVIGPLWIEKEEGASIPTDATIKFMGIVQGKSSHIVQSPLRLVAVPEVAPIKGLDVSLAWLPDVQQQNWPNFLRDFRKMGFSYVPTFPRYFAKDKDGKWNALTQKKLDLLQQARDAGYDVVYNESPFHVMWNTIETDQKASKIDEAGTQEIYNQIDGKRGKLMNPLYRGKYFQDEIERVAQLTKLVQPDHVYLDIEWWGPVVTESKKDPRMIAAWKASGKEWDDFVTEIGTEVLSTLVTAMRQAAPQKKMVVGLYHSEPKFEIYHNVFQFSKIYPNIIDIAQPSLYFQGRPQIIGDHIRYDYDVMQSRQIIPWLTTGTYGEYDPASTEPMVLEAVLNGSRGVTYYWFGDFDPMDFYYHSKALKSLAPYEALLKNGKPIAYKGDNPALHYTAFASDNEALVLVGNYGGALKGKVTLPLPFASAKKATLAGKNLAIKNGAIELDVPPGEFRLISLSE